MSILHDNDASFYRSTMTFKENKNHLKQFVKLVSIDAGGRFEESLHRDFKGDNFGIDEAREKRKTVIQRLPEEHPDADKLRPEVLSVFAIFLFNLLVIFLTLGSTTSVGRRQVTLGTESR